MAETVRSGERPPGGAGVRGRRGRRRGRARPGALLCAVVALLLAAWFAGKARADIGSYLVFDMTDGRIIAEKDPMQPWYPASLTKLMTAWVTFQAIRDGRVKETSPVRISPQAASQPPSRIGFRIGTVISIETALRILMTKSANDVSVALAEAIGGTERAFVEEMNHRAAELGMVQTFFTNPHGLPSHEQTTSARDMAILVRALKTEFPDKADYFDMSGVRIGERTFRNHNKLVTRFPGTTGMKTGFICSSGFNLAASARRDGREIVAIVLGGRTSRERNERTAEYLEKAFRRVAAGLVPADAPRLDDLVPGPDTPVEPVDLRPVVCGPTRPETPYDDGVVSFADLAPEVAFPGIVAAEETAQAYAPVADDGGEEAVEAVTFAAGTASMAAPDTAPQAPGDGDEAGAADAADGRAAAAPSTGGAIGPLDKPISYLRPVAGVPAPVALRIGDADPSRPNPLSGTVVGGGPAPFPRIKPKAVLVAKAAPADPGEVLALASAVRLAVAETGSGAAAGSESPRIEMLSGVPLPVAKPTDE